MLLSSRSQSLPALTIVADTRLRSSRSRKDVAYCEAAMGYSEVVSLISPRSVRCEGTEAVSTSANIDDSTENFRSRFVRFPAVMCVDLASSNSSTPSEGVRSVQLPVLILPTWAHTQFQEPWAPCVVWWARHVLWPPTVLLDPDVPTIRGNGLPGEWNTAPNALLVLQLNSLLWSTKQLAVHATESDVFSESTVHC